jgi:hypothetical protein
MGVAAWVLAGGSKGHTEVILAGLLGTGLWVGLNWLSDYAQKDEGRPVPPRWLLGCIILLCLVGGFSYGPASGAWVVIHFMLVWCYAKKKTVPVAARFSNLLRAGTVFALCAALTSAASGGFWPQGEAFWFSLVQAATHGARNLMGDIRDIRRDKYEIPARFGAGFALCVCVPYIVAAGFATLPLSAIRLPMQCLVLLLLVLLVVLWLWGRRIGYHKAGWAVHCAVVLCFTGINLWTLVVLDVHTFEHYFLIFLAALLHLTYPWVGREKKDQPLGWRSARKWLWSGGASPEGGRSSISGLHGKP